MTSIEPKFSNIKVSIFVKNQEEALQFYTQKLDFKKTADGTLPNGYRWLTVAPPGANFEFVLELATGEALERVGTQTGGKILAAMDVDQITKTYETWKVRGVEFLAPPEVAAWGTGVVFKDLYGNQFYLRQPPQQH
eukprot:TRINITY_DN4671_c0_g1_i1.p1 TRINITY_DN4671_c0_g1~~TRINITY_DN4671_c0_g1_i1.p1  ORF type:complete len:146 (-),score=32.10 TRINITY_DN4671_c0_g1_i1:67-474(-)